MDHHNKTMCKIMTMCNFSKTLVVDLDAKTGQVSIWCLWPYGKDTMGKLVGKN